MTIQSVEPSKCTTASDEMEGFGEINAVTGLVDDTR